MTKKTKPDVVCPPAAERKITKSLTWNEDFAARCAYERAAGCLEDALLVARERERYGLAVLVNDALVCLRNIGRFYGITQEVEP